jgi:hypothetical protein
MAFIPMLECHSNSNLHLAYQSQPMLDLPTRLNMFVDKHNVKISSLNNLVT